MRASSPFRDRDRKLPVPGLAGRSGRRRSCGALRTRAFRGRSLFPEPQPARRVARYQQAAIGGKVAGCSRMYHPVAVSRQGPEHFSHTHVPDSHRCLGLRRFCLPLLPAAPGQQPAILRQCDAVEKVGGGLDPREPRLRIHVPRIYDVAVGDALVAGHRQQLSAFPERHGIRAEQFGGSETGEFPAGSKLPDANDLAPMTGREPPAIAENAIDPVPIAGSFRTVSPERASTRRMPEPLAIWISANSFPSGDRTGMWILSGSGDISRGSPLRSASFERVVTACRHKRSAVRRKLDTEKADWLGRQAVIVASGDIPNGNGPAVGPGAAASLPSGENARVPRLGVLGTRPISLPVTTSMSCENRRWPLPAKINFPSGETAIA